MSTSKTCKTSTSKTAKHMAMVAFWKKHIIDRKLSGLTVKAYCEENDIERPDDLRFKTVAKKSASKVKIIQLIDNETPLDEVAKAQGMSFEALLNDLDSIVYSGTKLNIDSGHTVCNGNQLILAAHLSY